MDYDFKKIMAQLAAENVATFKALRELKEQIGGLNNKFGSFTEGLALPSMTKVLQDKFGAETISARVKSRKGGRSMEIDVLAYSNGKKNAAYIVEVKSHATDEALEQLQRELADFPKFFPEHKDKELYGILAGVDVSDELSKKALKAGIYVARISEEVFKLKVPAGFRAHSFKKVT